MRDFMVEWHWDRFCPVVILLMLHPHLHLYAVKVGISGVSENKWLLGILAFRMLECYTECVNVASSVLDRPEY